DNATIKDLLFSFGKNDDNIVAVIGSEANGKAVISIYISKPLVEKYSLHAGQLVKEAAKEIQGGGGGQSFFATAGGKNPKGLDQALNKAKTLVVDKLNL
ncbi:MAG TPA: alanine--tRNA ligase, partial [Flavobacteriales bacterium]|nr:alanine--tRNA ligase [Flavobacteriales bacterium]